MNKNGIEFIYLAIVCTLLELEYFHSREFLPYILDNFYTFRYLNATPTGKESGTPFK